MEMRWTGTNYKMAAKNKKRSKVVVVFNEEARKDFLLGFRRRKNERRKKAKEELEKKEKEKKKQLKAEKKKVLQEQVEQQRQKLETLESDLDDQDDTNEDIEATFDYPEHVVTVTTICDINLDEKSTCIGLNKVKRPHENVNNSKQESELCEQKTSKNGTLSSKKKFKTKWKKKGISTMKGMKEGKRKKVHQSGRGIFKRKKKM